MEFKNFQLSELPKVVRQTIALGQDFNTWIFKGEVGAGKTTFIAELLKQKGVLERVSSPTFSICQTYQTEEFLVHYDFYRLKSPEEAIEIGFFDFQERADLCLVEWPERIGDLIERPYLQLSFENIDANSRSLYLQKYE